MRTVLLALVALSLLLVFACSEGDDDVQPSTTVAVTGVRSPSPTQAHATTLAPTPTSPLTSIPEPTFVLSLTPSPAPTPAPTNSPEPTEVITPSPRPTPKPPVPLMADEADLTEALFRHIFAHNASAQHQYTSAYLLNIEGADPTDEFLARFAGNTPPVKRSSLATIDWDQGGVVKDSETGEDALIFRVYEIAVTGDTATASGGYHEAGLSASGSDFTLERQSGVWVVTDDVMRWIA